MARIRREEVTRLQPYEILLMTDPRLSEDEVVQLLAKLQGTLTELGATVQRVENWGKRRLAYEIRKQREGTYVVLEVLVGMAPLKEFERQLKLNELVLRFMSTRAPVRRENQPEPAPEPLEEVG